MTDDERDVYAAVAVIPITDENREALERIALFNAGTHVHPCVVCGVEFTQKDSRYWKIHEGCIEEFKKNREKYGRE